MAGGSWQLAGGCPLFVAQLYVMSLANTSSVLLARTFRFQLATTSRERHKENGPEEAAKTMLKTLKTDERLKNDQSGLQLRVAKCFQWGRQCLMAAYT